jgi:predicted DNA-binding transcriptional regulator AlpA
MAAFLDNRDTKPSPDKCGWRVNEFAAATGISRSLVYEKINEGLIDSVKLGTARIVTTSPSDFLAALAKTT